MKVLVPIDGSKHSTEGLRVASHFAKANKAKIFILNVIPSVADVDLELTASERDRLLESLKRRGEDLLAKAKDQMKSHGVTDINTVLSTADSPAQEIVSFAEKEKIDLIVIGSKGKSATARFLLGSVASKVVKYSHCCVYVVKEPCWA
ncbi:MAG: universal stress protein [Nitrospirae bacterium]|nr:universal stress protein [Nitrospirota bacterium]NTW65740.1 universal stress protein [Nitrospirota bacterium]